MARLLIAAALALALILIISNGYSGSPILAAVPGSNDGPALGSSPYHDDGEEEDDEDDEDDEVGGTSDADGWGNEATTAAVLASVPAPPSPPPTAVLAAPASATVSAQPGPSPTSAATAGDPPVQMLNKRFSPPSITVTAGDTITWTNIEGGHTATSYGGLWDSGMMTPGQTFSWTANVAPGVYRYKCIPHEEDGMIGEVTVLAASSSPPPALAPSGPAPSGPAQTTSAPSPSAPASDPASQTSPAGTQASPSPTSPSAQGLPVGGGEPPGTGVPLGTLLPFILAGLTLVSVGAVASRFALGKRR